MDVYYENCGKISSIEYISLLCSDLVTKDIEIEKQDESVPLNYIIKVNRLISHIFFGGSTKVEYVIKNIDFESIAKKDVIHYLYNLYMNLDIEYMKICLEKIGNLEFSSKLFDDEFFDTWNISSPELLPFHLYLFIYHKEIYYDYCNCEDLEILLDYYQNCEPLEFIKFLSSYKIKDYEINCFFKKYPLDFFKSNIILENRDIFYSLYSTVDLDEYLGCITLVDLGGGCISWDGEIIPKVEDFLKLHGYIIGNSYNSREPFIENFNDFIKISDKFTYLIDMDEFVSWNNFLLHKNDTFFQYYNYCLDNAYSSDEPFIQNYDKYKKNNPKLPERSIDIMRVYTKTRHIYTTIYDEKTVYILPLHNKNKYNQIYCYQIFEAIINNVNLIEIMYDKFDMDISFLDNFEFYSLCKELLLIPERIDIYKFLMTKSSCYRLSILLILIENNYSNNKNLLNLYTHQIGIYTLSYFDSYDG